MLQVIGSMQNKAIRGGIPSNIRITTKAGMIPIKDSEDTGRVWTGTRWADYKKIDLDRRPLIQIQLANGQIFKCCAGNDLLVVGANGYEIKTIDQIDVGDRICLSLAEDLDNGTSWSLPADTAYWLAYSTACSYVINNKTRRNQNILSISFRDKKGLYKGSDKRDQFITYLDNLEFNYSRWASQPNRVVVCDNRFAKWWDKLGFQFNGTAYRRCIPKIIWESKYSQRVEFLKGMLDAYGSNYDKHKRIKISNIFLLLQLQILVRSIGIASKITGPYTYVQTPKYYMHFNIYHLSKHGFYPADYDRSKRITLRFIVEDFLRKIKGSKIYDDADKSLIRRMKNSKNISVYSMRRLIERYNIDLELYDTSRVVSKDNLGIQDRSYMLFAEDQPYDAEGIINVGYMRNHK